jgi:Ca-activated chloride channel homolog
VQRFDQLEGFRSRTVVLATDNVVAGDSIYTTPEAARLAAEHDIMVFGVMPAEGDPRATEQLRTATRSTGGDVVTIAKGEPTNVARISSAITAQQKSVLLAQAQDRSFDVVWPGAALLLLGLAGSIALAWRRR